MRCACSKHTSPDRCPVSAASEYHLALLKCHPSQKQSVAEDLAKGILEDEQKSSICSTVLSLLVHQHGISNFKYEDRLNASAARLKDNKMEQALRRTRAISIPVALWSLAVIQHYGIMEWSHTPLESLRDTAQALSWRDFKKAANHMMLQRHIASFSNAKSTRIGEGRAKGSFPVLASELSTIRESRPSEQDVQLVSLWVAREYDQIPVDGGTLADDKRTTQEYFHVGFDEYGLLVPASRAVHASRPSRSLNNKRWGESSGKPAATVTVSQHHQQALERKQSSEIGRHLQPLSKKSLPATNAPSSPAAPTPAPLPGTSLAPEDESPIDSTSQLISFFHSPPQSAPRFTSPLSDDGPTPNAPTSRHSSPSQSESGTVPAIAVSSRFPQWCERCGSIFKIRGSDKGWPQDLWGQMVDAAHEGKDLAAQMDNSILSLWINDLCLPSVSRSSSLGIFASEVSVDKGEVILLDVAELLQHLNRGDVFTKPVLIREPLADTEAFTLDSFGEILWNVYVGLKIEVQQDDHPKPKAMDVERLVEGLKGGEPLNALSLCELTNACPPALKRSPRFHLLRDLVLRVKAQYQKNTGKQTQYYDVASCEDFNILGGRGAFSGAHVDALNGTWIRNLFGTKLWFFVPIDSMDDNDWKDFARDGLTWDPKGKGRAIFIPPGYTLLLPPGLLCIHAVLTLSPCLMLGGMIWDTNCLESILKNIYWIGMNQLTTNEPIPFQMATIVDELAELKERKTGSIWAADLKVDHAIQALRSLGCHCEMRCTARSCKCIVGNRRCTPFCRNHATKAVVQCMQDNPR